MTGDRLLRLIGLVTGTAGMDSGLLSRVEDEAATTVVVLLLVCVLGEIITMKNCDVKIIFTCN